MSTLTKRRSVKPDTPFSYQPPFNILAFILLKPAYWVLSPRALHSFNVFLTSLIIIGIYERRLAAGKKFRETSKDAAQSLFNSLPMHIKSLPLIEALVGSAYNDLFDDDYELFGDSDADMDAPAFRSLHSRENLKHNVNKGNVTPSKENRNGKKRHESPSPVPQIHTGTESQSYFLRAASTRRIVLRSELAKAASALAKHGQFTRSDNDKDESSNSARETVHLEVFVSYWEFSAGGG